MSKNKKIKKLQKALKAARKMSDYWMKDYLSCSHDLAAAVTEKREAHHIIGTIVGYNAALLKERERLG